jgi:hypothetical protein
MITLCLLFAAFMAMAAVFAVLLYAGIAAGCVLVWAFRRWCVKPDAAVWAELEREQQELEAAWRAAGGDESAYRELIRRPL